MSRVVRRRLLEGGKMKKLSAFLGVLITAFTFVFSAPVQGVDAQEVSAQTAFEQKVSFYTDDGSSEVEVNVEKGLIKQIKYYQSLLSLAKADAQKEQIESLIQTTAKLLNESTGRTISTATTEKDQFHVVFSSAAASVIAYFSAKEYYFAAELMTHAWENKKLDSVYYPINGSLVKTSSAFEEIRANDEISGTGRFARQGSVKDMDLYYALHQFNYSKFDGGKKLVINDRYDFIRNGGFVWPDELPIQVMYEAQEAGVIIPYYSVIETEVEPSENPLTGVYRHLEYVDGEYHIYNDVCDGTCEVSGCTVTRANSHTDEELDGKCDVCKIVIADEGKTNFDEMGTYFRELWNRFRSVKNKVENKVSAGCNGTVSGTSALCIALLVCGLTYKKGKKK